MLKSRPGIILRKTKDGFFLFDVTQGRLLPFNAMAARIWKYLENGISEDDLLQNLRQVLGGNTPDSLVADVRQFLAALKQKRLISDGDSSRQEAVLDTTVHRDGMPLYHYHGMRGVMEGGYDAVVTENVDFDTIRAGDIVATHPDGPAQSGCLFRIVKRTASELVGVGEDEPLTAVCTLHAEDAPRRVTALVSPANVRRSVHGGLCGLLAFVWHRLLRWGRCVLDFAAALLPWRTIPDEWTIVNAETRYFYRGRLVIRRWGKNVQFIPWWNRFRFKLNQ